MAKIRAIKPEFFTDEDIVEASPLARILFAGLWCHACDSGHLKDKPRQIKLRILPADDCDADALLGELVKVGCITRANGWITIPHLERHQKPDKRYFLTCDYPSCRTAKPPVKTRREAPREHDEFPPDPLDDHTETTPGPHREHDVATRSPSTDGDGDGDGDGDTSSELRPEVEALLDHLDRNVAANGARVPSRSKKNVDAARLIIELDGRDAVEAHRLIDWSTSNEFWKANILSMSKFREKYDQLRMQAGSNRGHQASQQDVGMSSEEYYTRQARKARA